MLFYKLGTTSLVPPGGWNFIHPKSGAKISGGDYRDMLSNIRAHDRANGWPTMTERDIQDQMCRAMDDAARPYYCELYDPATDPKPPRARRQVTIEDAIRFANVIRKGITEARNPFVPQEEAVRRASICSMCPMNVTISGCTSCRNLVHWVSQAIGRRETALDGHLRGCEVCGCENRVAVHVDLGIQQATISDELNEEFPDHCWKKRRESVGKNEQQECPFEEPQDHDPLGKVVVAEAGRDK